MDAFPTDVIVVGAADFVTTAAASFGASAAACSGSAGVTLAFFSGGCDVIV